MKAAAVTSMALIKGIAPEQMETVKKSLTLFDRFTGKTLTLYEDAALDNEKLWIPRGMVEKQALDFPTWKLGINYKFLGRLTPDQERVEKEYLNYLKTHNGGIIQADTGLGKTVIALSIIEKLGLRTLIVVPTDHLMKQWIERIEEFTNKDREQVGIIRGAHGFDPLHNVCVGMIHSLCSIDYTPRLPSFYHYYGLVIYDEVHTLAAETFSETAKKFWCKYTLGLSATPRRKDGMQNVFFWNIGQICSVLKRGKINAQVIVLKYPGRDAYHDGQRNLGGYITQLSRIPQRNSMILDCITTTYEKSREVLVLSDRINQLKNLKTELRHLGVDCGLWTNTVKEKDKKVLLATYGSAGLGADIPRLNTLILATPRADIEQSVGRILRTDDHEKPPTIIDIVDSCSATPVKWFNERRRYYNKITDKIVELKGGV
jgi:superfamily II DNA or RNA helicase